MNHLNLKVGDFVRIEEDVAATSAYGPLVKGHILKISSITRGYVSFSGVLGVYNLKDLQNKLNLVTLERPEG